MHAIAFTGLPGSGKSEAVAVAQDLRLSVVNMGDEVRAEIKRRNLDPTDENLGQIATEMREQHGQAIWAQRTLARIEQQSMDCIIIDGIRNIEEVEAFRENIDAFILVAIHASPHARYSRLMQRGRSDDVLSEPALRRRDQRELGWGLGIVMAMSDVAIVNEGPLADFQKKVKILIGDIVKE
jgi:dephospho-CoA kinase